MIINGFEERRDQENKRNKCFQNYLFFNVIFIGDFPFFFFFFFSSCVSALCHLKVALLDSQLDRWVPFSCDNAI